MAGEPAATMSKSAKRRANAKAKEAAAAQEAAQTAPAAPEPKAKAKAKAQAPTPEAPAPKATPKAPAAPKAESKAKAAPKSGSKPAKAPVDDDEPPRKKEEPLAYYTMDDGTGGDWEVSTGLTKKQQKQKERKEEQAAAIKAAKEAGGYPGQKQIPGMGPIPGQAPIPGMAPAAKAKTAVSQSLVAAPVAAPVAAAAAAGTEAAEVAAPKDQAVASVTVPEAKVGIVIGPKGSMINLIKEKTEVKGVDVNGGVFTITGSAAAVAMAEAAINEIAQKGYCSLAFDDFQENCVNVHPDFFPEIIGKKGAVIQAIKKELGVEVKIPETQKGGPAGKKYKVTIAGKGENTEKAKEVLNDIMMYYHHEVTHPGEAHEELEIEPWQYSFVIGPKGSQLRHVQNNYGVRVHIPRESSLNSNVVIVGAPNDVTRAKANIEKILYNAANQVKGRDREDRADDGWGDEGEEEEWMKQYMFRRR